jgi:hypothetical protein
MLACGIALFLLFEDAVEFWNSVVNLRLPENRE